MVKAILSNSFLERRDARRKFSESLGAGASLTPRTRQRIPLGSENDWKFRLRSCQSWKASSLSLGVVVPTSKNKYRMGYVGLGRDNLRSHFVFRPRHPPEWLRARFLPVVFLTNKGELTGETFTTSLNTTNPNTYMKFIFLRTSPLRKQAAVCRFESITPDEILRDKIVSGVQNERLRRSLLFRRKLDLKECITECRMRQQAEKQAATMASGNSQEREAANQDINQASTHAARKRFKPLRRIPLPVKEDVGKELLRLEKLGVITHETRPTDWVSGMVVAKKPSGKLHICLDLKPLNKAWKRSHFPSTVLEDVIPELGKAKCFSICDITSGYFEIGTSRWMKNPVCLLRVPF